MDLCWTRVLRDGFTNIPIYNKKSINVVEMSVSGSKKVKQLEDGIKELERSIGQKQFYIGYMERKIEV